MVRIVGQSMNSLMSKGPKCHGIHPKVVGYVCPYCGAGRGKQQQQQAKKQLPKLIPSWEIKASPSMRVVGNKLAK